MPARAVPTTKTILHLRVVHPAPPPAKPDPARFELRLSTVRQPKSLYSMGTHNSVHTPQRKDVRYRVVTIFNITTWRGHSLPYRKNYMSRHPKDCCMGRIMRPHTMRIFNVASRGYLTLRYKNYTSPDGKNYASQRLCDTV